MKGQRYICNYSSQNSSCLNPFVPFQLNCLETFHISYLKIYNIHIYIFTASLLHIWIHQIKLSPRLLLREDLLRGVCEASLKNYLTAPVKAKNISVFYLSWGFCLSPLSSFLYQEEQLSWGD